MDRVRVLRSVEMFLSAEHSATMTEGEDGTERKKIEASGSDETSEYESFGF